MLHCAKPIAQILRLCVVLYLQHRYCNAPMCKPIAQRLRYCAVPSSQILLHCAVPTEQIVRHCAAPSVQILFQCALPAEQIVRHCAAPFEAKFLDEIQTKVSRVFLLAIHSHLYSFALSFQFLQTHATSCSF
jgi:hypothetical protein